MTGSILSGPGRADGAILAAAVLRETPSGSHVRVRVRTMSQPNGRVVTRKGTWRPVAVSHWTPLIGYVVSRAGQRYRVTDDQVIAVERVE